MRGALFCMALPLMTFVFAVTESQKESQQAPWVETKKQTKDSPPTQENRSISTKSTLSGAETNAGSRKSSEYANNRGDEGTEFWPALFGYRLKITDTLLVLFTFGLFCATIYLYRATRDLVVGAEETAKRQLRAYVAMESVFFAVGEIDALFAETFRFAGRVFTTDNLKIRPKNYGSTPAFDTSIYCCAHTARPANFAINAALFGRQMLHPGMEQSHHVPSPKHAEEFSVWGHIVYRDIHNRWWRTNFFYAHQKESVFIPEPEYNEEKGPYKTEAEALSQ